MFRTYQFYLCVKRWGGVLLFSYKFIHLSATSVVSVLMHREPLEIISVYTVCNNTPLSSLCILSGLYQLSFLTTWKTHVILVYTTHCQTSTT